MNKSIIHHFRSRLRAREHLFLAVATAMACGTLTEVAHAQIFVPNYGNGNVGEYSTAGATINASLLTGLTEAATIAAAGTSLFIETDSNDNIGKYTTAGATVSASFVTGLSGPWGLVVTGGDLYVMNEEASGRVGVYNATTGAVINSALFSTGTTSYGLALLGPNLLTANFTAGTIGEYTTGGLTVNASFITGLDEPVDLTVLSVIPESSAWAALAGGGVLALAVLRRRRRGQGRG